MRSLPRIVPIDEKRTGRRAVRLADQFLAEIRIGSGQEMLAGIVLVARASLGQGAVGSHAVGVGHCLSPESLMMLTPLIPAPLVIISCTRNYSSLVPFNSRSFSSLLFACAIRTRIEFCERPCSCILSMIS